MTDRNLALARRLWDEDVPLRSIGARVGCSKNAVAGYAHRNGWPARESPIGRGREGWTPKPATTPRAPERSHHKAAPKVPRAPRPLALASAKTVLPKPVAPLALPAPAFRACQWPLTDGRPWRFCEAPTVRGTAWCSEHHARCYGRPQRLAEAA